MSQYESSSPNQQDFSLGHTFSASKHKQLSSPKQTNKQTVKLTHANVASIAAKSEKDTCPLPFSDEGLLSHCKGKIVFGCNDVIIVFVLVILFQIASTAISIDNIVGSGAFVFLVAYP